MKKIIWHFNIYRILCICYQCECFYPSFTREETKATEEEFLACSRADNETQTFCPQILGHFQYLIAASYKMQILSKRDNLYY